MGSIDRFEESPPFIPKLNVSILVGRHCDTGILCYYVLDIFICCVFVIDSIWILQSSNKAERVEEKDTGWQR